MKFTTVFFTLLSLLTFVAALPSPVTPLIEANIVARELELQDLQQRFDENDPIIKRFFSHNHGLTEADFVPGAQGTVEPRFMHVVAEVVVEGVIALVNLIKGKVEHDKKVRSQWTSDMISTFRKKYPHYNFVLCHTKHSTEFKGQQGKDWGHTHQELPVSFHKTVGYEIYWFREGKFHRKGDGGWLNWAYGGHVLNRNDRDVTFGTV